MKATVSLLAVLLLAGCGGGSPSAPDGCLAVGDAGYEFNKSVDAVKAGTLTDTDLASSMGKVAGKLKDAALIAPSSIAAIASSGADAAGRARVALLNNDGTAVATEIASVRTQIDAADAACTAAKK